jgi:hypothetical protein
MSVEATAQDRVKYLLTIKRNERSPSSEIPAHHHRNAHADDGNIKVAALKQAWSDGNIFL